MCDARCYVFVGILLLNGVCAVVGRGAADYAFAMVHEIDSPLTRRSLADDNLPQYLNIELRVGGKPKTIRLQRNDNVDVNVPVTFEDADDEDEESRIENVAMYQDVVGGAAMTVTHDVLSGRTKRTFEGSFQVGAVRYGIEPSSSVLDTLAHVMERRGNEQGPHNDGVLHRIYRLVEGGSNDGDDHTRQADDVADDVSDEVTDDVTDDVVDGDPDDFTDSVSEVDVPSVESASVSIESGSDGEATEVASDPRFGSDAEEFVAKRKTGSMAVYHVQMAFVVDHTIWDHWMKAAKNNKRRALRKLRAYFGHQINGIDLAYKSIDSTKWALSITPFLKRIYIAKTAKASVWTVPFIFQKSNAAGRSLVDAPAVLSRMAKWVTSGGRSWKNPDHAILWTRYDLRIARDGSDITGYAPLGRVCLQGGGISAQEDIGIHAWSTGAHELAHNLGAMHDGSGNGCEPNDKYIMAPSHGYLASKSLLNNAYMFSDCSVKYFKDTLSGTSDGYPRVCLTNRVCRHSLNANIVGALAGKRYSLDEQCRLRHGPTYSWIDLGSKVDMCFALACRLGNRYRVNNPGAADGSKCGKNMCCRQGKCVKNCDKYTVKLDSDCKKTSLLQRVPKGCNNVKAMKCWQYSKLMPYLCFTSSVVKERCCRACHRAGLVAPTQHLVSLREFD